jgi:hypothetical protein
VKKQKDENRKGGAKQEPKAAQEKQVSSFFMVSAKCMSSL